MDIIATIIGIVLVGIALRIAYHWPRWRKECDGKARRKLERLRNEGSGQ
mgnify:CR=1 FL=1